MKSRFKKGKMHCRVQSAQELHDTVAEKLKGEFNARYEQAILEGAMQGIAFVMYTLDLCYKWRDQRQKKLFQEMLNLMDLPDLVPQMQQFNALDIKKHIEEKYGLDFRQLVERVTAEAPKLEVEVVHGKG